MLLPMPTPNTWPDVGRWISADQQHAPSGLGKLNGRCAGNRSLAHAAFAGEEEEARRLIEKVHDLYSIVQQHLLPEQQLPADFVSVAIGDMPAQRASSARFGITARQRDFAIDEYQRQRFLA